MMHGLTNTVPCLPVRQIRGAATSQRNKRHYGAQLTSRRGRQSLYMVACDTRLPSTVLRTGNLPARRSAGRWAASSVRQAGEVASYRRRNLPG